MSDFTNGFWPLFIATVTIVSIVALVWLIRWTSKSTASKDPTETMGHVWDEDLEELNSPLPRWWLYKFYLTLAFGAVYLILYPGLGSFRGALGWTEVGQYEQEVAAAEARFGPIYRRYLDQKIPALVNNPEAVKIGERLFSTYCTTCHGSDARGVRGFPNLRDNDWLHGGTPGDIEETIRHGRTAAMPAWQEALGRDGVFNVAEYVRSLSGVETDSIVAAKGKEIFTQFCAVCHGANGEGNQVIGAPNLSDNIWLYGGSQNRIQESIAGGRNGHMPAHGEFLGDAKVHLLAAYVFGLRVDKDLAK